jgi:hypothetical protein
MIKSGLRLGLGLNAFGCAVIGNNEVFPVSANISTDEPKYVNIVFALPIDGTSIPATSAFSLAGKTIDTITVNGSTVTLHVTSGYLYGDTPTLNYTQPGANPLKLQTLGNLIGSFTNQVITNNLLFFINANSLGLYDYQDSSTLTMNGSKVITWACKLGSGHNLTQATDSKRPLLTATGIYFDKALAQYLKTGAFTWGAPATLYMVVRPDEWVLNTYIMDGSGNNSMALYHGASGNTNKLMAYSPATALQGGVYTPTAYTIVSVCWNGASSWVRVNATKTNGTTGGTPAAGAFTMMAKGLGGNNSTGEVKYALIRNIAEAPTDEVAIYNYLKTKYSL